MSALANAQERFAHGAFARALLDPNTPAPCGLPARRFAVYRNNVVVGLIDALAARFPVCQRLVGEEFFRAMARVFVLKAPPRSKIMQQYGEGFAEFIAKFEPTQDLPYLADVARFEYAMGLAYHAADAPATSIAAISPEALSQSRLALHPSVQLVASPYPIVSIWRTNNGDGDPSAIDLTQGEDALIQREGEAVTFRILPAGGFAFFSALARGELAAEAIDKGQDASENFDLVACLQILICGEAIVGIDSR